MYKRLVAVSWVGLTSLHTLATHSVSVHISESGVMSTNHEPLSGNPSQTIYISEDTLKPLNPADQKDASKLAESIELEIYRTTENSQTHTVFVAAPGVCRGYKERGVEVTDSATYYIKEKSKDEYYANISGGILNSRGEAKRVQYASVFNVNDAELSKRLREQEKTQGKVIAEQNLRDRIDVLANDVCKQN